HRLRHRAYPAGHSARWVGPFPARSLCRPQAGMALAAVAGGGTGAGPVRPPGRLVFRLGDAACRAACLTTARSLIGLPGAAFFVFGPPAAVLVVACNACALMN